MPSVRFTLDQLNEYHRIIRKHGCNHGGIDLLPEESREMFTELLRVMLRGMDQKQHSQIQRLL